MKRFALLLMLLSICVSSMCALQAASAASSPNPPALTPEAKEGYRIIKLYFDMLDAFKAAMAGGNEPTEAQLAPYYRALKTYENACDTMANRIIAAYKSGNKVPWENFCAFNRSLYPDMKAALEPVGKKVIDQIVSSSMMAGEPVGREELEMELTYSL